ncbi:hypothetical protein D3C76_849290 [compost metagenome]
MVEHHFDAGLGNRERHAGVGALQRLVVVGQRGAGGVLKRIVLHELRIAYSAMRRINVDAETRQLLDQCLGAFRELVAVGVHVTGVDRELRFFIGEGIGTNALGLVETGGRGFQPAGIGRNGAIGITGHLGTHGGQAGAQLLGFLL